MVNDAAAKRKTSVCVYCGSASGADGRYAAAARVLGAAIAAAGFGLVYGGGGIGLMGEVALAVRRAGGDVLGIIPGFLQEREVHFKDATELVVTRDMHERKMLMFERADAFVALPGGIGTLEELIEQMTWSQLGRHTKPIVIANIGGFWQPLLTLLGHMEAEGFLRKPFIAGKASDLYHVVDTAEEIVPRIVSLLSALEPSTATEDIAHNF